MTLAIPIAVFLLGTFLFFITPGKWAEFGKQLLFAGLLVSLFVAAGHALILK